MELILDDGRPSPDFERIVSDTITAWLQHYDHTGQRTQFLVMAVQDKNGRESYWGMVDIPNTPREDLYVEIERRFYCAYRTLGEETLLGMGLIDIYAILNRATVDLREHLPPQS